MYKQTLWLVWACLLVGSVMLAVQLYKKVESGHRRSGADGLVDTEQETDNINAREEEREEREEENEEHERVEEKEKREEDKQLATTISCSRKGDWVDICEYTNVCFDGTNRLVLFDGNSNPSTFIPRRATRPKEGVSSFGATWFESIPFPPPPPADLPHSTQWEGTWHNARNKLAPPYGNGHMKSVWLNGTTVFMIPDVKETNLWHWGVSLFPIMEVHETTPVKNLLIRRLKRDSAMWEVETAPLVVPGANVLFQEEWGPIIGRMDDRYYEDNPEVSTMICAKRVFLTSPRASFFANPRQCYNLRKEAYYRSDIDPSKAHESAAPKKILIAQRPDRWSRNILNMHEALDILKSYDIDYELVNFGTGETLKEQLEKMSSAGVYAYVHGAAGANIPFLPYHSAVIEIFPYNWGPTMYKGITGICNHLYYPLHQWAGLEIDLSPEDEKYCDSLSRRDAVIANPCATRYKSSKVVLDLKTFEQAVLDAFQDIGYPVRRAQ